MKKIVLLVACIMFASFAFAQTNTNETFPSNQIAAELIAHGARSSQTSDGWWIWFFRYDDLPYPFEANPKQPDGFYMATVSKGITDLHYWVVVTSQKVNGDETVVITIKEMHSNSSHVCLDESDPDHSNICKDGSVGILR